MCMGEVEIQPSQPGTLFEMMTGMTAEEWDAIGSTESADEAQP
jgi:hypothetical protein